LVELFGAIARIAQRGAHGRIFIRYLGWLCVVALRREDAGAIAGAERLARAATTSHELIPEALIS
jgi:hypothetical protein